MKIPFSAIQVMNGGDGVAFCSNNLSEYNRSEAIQQATKLYDIQQHPIKNKAKRPDKKTTVLEPSKDFDEKGIPIKNMVTKIVPIERNSLDIANYIIGQKTTLVTGAGVGLDADDTDSELYKKVKQNWDNAKFEYDISNVFSTLKKETQVAIILFGKKTGLKEYGYKLVSPNRGDTLIPYFDEETEDFIGLQREYERNTNNYVDLYYKDLNGLPRLKRIVDQVEISDEQLPYNDLPIIYFEQDENELYNVAELIYALEDTLNRYIDNAKYFENPILFSKGSNIDLPAQTDMGKVFIGKDPESDMKFVTPENATEMTRLHFDSLDKWIFLLSHSVRLDAESLKGLGKAGLSGEAIERLMTDAYMYASNQQNGEFGKGIQRLVNWLTKEHSSLSKNPDDLHIKAKFRKYSLRGEQERVDLFMKANGGLPVISQEESITGAGLAKDTDFVTKVE